MSNIAHAFAFNEVSTPPYSQVSQPAAMISKSARSGLIARGPLNASTNNSSSEHNNVREARSKSAANAPQPCGKSTAGRFNVAGLMAWLRQQHPKATIHEVSARTGIPAASVENWLHGRSNPSVQHFSIIIAVYGACAFAACFEAPPEWLQDATYRQRERELDDEILRLQLERERCRGRR